MSSPFHAPPFTRSPSLSTDTRTQTKERKTEKQKPGWRVSHRTSRAKPAEEILRSPS
jgi:hypothetical protein